MIPVWLLDLKFLHSGCRKNGRNFKSATLAVLAVVGLAVSCGGCSSSHQLGSLLEKGIDEHDGDRTGSIASAKSRAGKPDDGDLDLARAAATEVLSHGKDTTLPWENPRTGARGTVTPIAAAYDQGGLTCRDFLASYVNGSDEAWLQGAACRIGHGHWEVRSLKPRSQS